MGVSGFKIKARTKGFRANNTEWFLEEIGPVSITDALGDARVTFLPGFPADFQGGQFIILISDDVRKTYNGASVVNSLSATAFTASDISYVSDQTGILYRTTFPVDILWDSDTPLDILREIQVQFDVVPSSELSLPIISITLDGINFIPINNGNTIHGVATFTFFVKADSKLNFIASEEIENMGCIVSSG